MGIDRKGTNTQAPTSKTVSYLSLPVFEYGSVYSLQTFQRV